MAGTKWKYRTTSIGSIVGLVPTNNNQLSVKNGLLDTRQEAA